MSVLDRLLTPSERDRFATYCEQQAETSRLMAAQIAKLGIKQLECVERNKAAAYAIVAADLRSVIDETIEGAPA